MRPLTFLLLASCSFTPIPDVTSNYVEPCDTALRVCPVAFTLKAANERSVELRGDFRDGGWVDGVAMEKATDTWSASLQVPWGATVQYKFFIDGSRWILDPANTQSVPDGKGNTNSIVRDVTCAKWSCRAAQ
jgi:1,4-alpha-glucan branching enzyme